MSRSAACSLTSATRFSRPPLAAMPRFRAGFFAQWAGEHPRECARSRQQKIQCFELLTIDPQRPRVLYVEILSGTRYPVLSLRRAGPNLPSDAAMAPRSLPPSDNLPPKKTPMHNRAVPLPLRGWPYTYFCVLFKRSSPSVALTLIAWFFAAQFSWCNFYLCAHCLAHPHAPPRVRCDNPSPRTSLL